ncbi:MAG TPA: hypothetical protein VLI05_00635 [Candidatus Saccharimonadia bacterium]|nr:hypothetical protein [Candidatus Saccharimonadia bacterium]
MNEKVELIRLERGKTAFDVILAYVRSIPALREDMRELKDRTERMEQQLARLAKATEPAPQPESAAEIIHG